MKKLYIAGPMTGIPEKNFPLFNEAERFYDDQYEVLNPAKLTVHCPDDHQEIIRIDVEAVLSCDAIAMLPTWYDSVGANAEHALAVWRKIPVKYYLLDKIELCLKQNIPVSYRNGYVVATTATLVIFEKYKLHIDQLLAKDIIFH